VDCPYYSSLKAKKKVYGIESNALNVKKTVVYKGL
jgi:hypothetical protein